VVLLGVREEVTPRSRIPSSGHLRPTLNREILFVGRATPPVSPNRAKRTWPEYGREYRGLVSSQTLGREQTREAERGVTLVETLVALLILSLVALSILQIFTQGVQLNVTGADYTALTNAVKDKTEELLALAFNHVDLTAGVTHSETITNPPLAVSWRVGDHQIRQGADDPTTSFGTDPLVSTSTVTNANVKVIAVTVASQSEIGLGNRDVTVQAIKPAD